ncbi:MULTISPECIES: Ig-like domain-containing protein [Actinomycetes]|uniref:Ig-like domain-containing protein n=1 Tax=Actinomycetes TaxID=1760 RepID=UPI0012DD6864|nr:MULTISPECIES: Ig-like domain-containing protein [Actinomycetes]
MATISGMDPGFPGLPPSERRHCGFYIFPPAGGVIYSATPFVAADGTWTSRVDSLAPGEYEIRLWCSNGRNSMLLNITSPTLVGFTITDYGSAEPNGNDPRNVPNGESADSKWWEWPDGDGDGIPDHWETNGVWVGNVRLDLASQGASSTRKDLFIYVDYESGYQLDSAVYEHVKQAFANSPLAVSVHFVNGRVLPSDASKELAWTGNEGSYQAIIRPDFARAATASGSISSPWLGGGAVPQLAKYFASLDYRPTSDKVVGTAYVTSSLGAGRAGWVAYNPDPLWRETPGGYVPELEGIHFSQASNLMHEIGHTLGLNHFGAHECANWQEIEQNAQSGPPCQAGSTRYLSVMSYAYNITGVPSETRGGPNRIDYSRLASPHYDWQLGTNPGQLRFIPGQFGEFPEMTYAAQALANQVASEALPESTSFNDLTRYMTPAGFDSFAATIGETGRPAFPAFASPPTAFTSTGSPVSALLPATNSSGTMTIAVEDAPDHGKLLTDGMRFTYTPDAGFIGDDTVSVRATNGVLSSDPLTLTFTVSAPAPPAGSGSSDGWGSS